MFLEA